MFVFIYVYISQRDNETAVWIASKEGHLEVVKALVAAGADLSKASVSNMLDNVSITIAVVVWDCTFVVLPLYTTTTTTTPPFLVSL